MHRVQTPNHIKFTPIHETVQTAEILIKTITEKFSTVQSKTRCQGPKNKEQLNYLTDSRKKIDLMFWMPEPHPHYLFDKDHKLCCKQDNR